MLVVIGNTRPRNPRGHAGAPLTMCVTTFGVPDDYTITDDGTTGRALLEELERNPYVTHLPAHEAFVNLLNPASGIVKDHVGGPIEFVEVRGEHDDNRAPILERQLAEALACQQGTPDDLEERYHTANGPPGVGAFDSLVRSLTKGTP